MQIGNEKDFWSGLMFIAFGLFFAVFAQNYDFGTPQRMGPAFFPTVLGGLLIVLGFVVGVQGLRVKTTTGKLEKFHLGPLLWVLGAIVTYALILRQAGLLVALAVLITISSIGSHEFRWKEVAVLSVAMGALVWVVFIWGLKMTIPVWPVFLSQ